MKKIEIEIKTAEKLESLLHDFENNEITIINYLTSTRAVSIYSKNEILVIINALINGYEVKKTPEQKILEYKKSLLEKINNNNLVAIEDYIKGQIVAIDNVMAIYNIKEDFNQTY